MFSTLTLAFQLLSESRLKTADRLLKKKKKGKRKYTWDTNVHTLVAQNMLQFIRSCLQNGV